MRERGGSGGPSPGRPRMGGVRCSYLGAAASSPLWNGQALSRKKMASTESFRQRAYVEQQGPAGRMAAFSEEAGGCQSDLFPVNESNLGVSRRS